jgi:hypothetical protein
MSEKALFLRRQLWVSDSERFELGLAESLGNHAGLLANQGHHEEALDLSKDALDLRRKFAERLPERFEPDLANSLRNHATDLWYQGRYEEALELSKDALDLHRKLAVRLPERFEPDLAKSLNDYAAHLANRGQHEEALKPSKEALDLCRQLAERCPGRFEPDLARSLFNQAIYLAAKGDWTAAFSACSDAVARLRVFERFQSHIHGVDLGDALLWADLLAWIRTGQAPGGRADIAAIRLTGRNFESLAFRHAAVELMFAAVVSDCDLRSEAQACLLTWGVLDRVQQSNGEDIMLVVSAVLNMRGLPPLEPGWRERWRRFAERHQRHIPQWMLAAMQRTGADLPAS